MLFCSNSYQTWGHTTLCLWIIQCAQCGMHTSFRGVAGLLQDAGGKECQLKTRERETTFFFTRFTLLSVYLNKTTEMEPLGNNNGNLLPPSSMWFPSIATCSLLSPRPSLAFLLIKVSPEVAGICYSLGHGVENS